LRLPDNRQNRRSCKEQAGFACLRLSKYNGTLYLESELWIFPRKSAKRKTGNDESSGISHRNFP
jgi:hypothetical protein